MKKRTESTLAERTPPVADWKAERMGVDCTTCGDCGMHDVCGFWQWCSCPGGARRRDESPEMVHDANRALDALKSLGKGKSGIRRRPPDETPVDRLSAVFERSMSRFDGEPE